jgi:exodeoxyribonuclease VII large subunit
VAAETAVPDAGVVGASLDTFARRLARTLTGQLTVAAQRLARTGDRLGAAAGRGLADQRHRMTELAGRLESLSPLRVLARGYAVARGPDGDVLKRVAQFVPGRRFRLTVSDGDVDAQVRGGQT